MINCEQKGLALQRSGDGIVLPMEFFHHLLGRTFSNDRSAAKCVIHTGDLYPKVPPAHLQSTVGDDDDSVAGTAAELSTTNGTEKK